MEQANNYIKNILEEGSSKKLGEIFEIKYYPRNFSFGPHTHNNVEINYVKSGTCYLKLNEKVFSFSNGDCMIIYPDVQHFFFTTDKKASLVQLEFKLDIFPQMNPSQGLKQNLPFLYQLLTNTQKLLKIKDNIEINRLVNKAVRELNEKKQNYKILTRLYFGELFVLLSRELNSRIDFLKKRPNPVIEKVLQFIHSNYYQTISLELLSKEIGISSRYLRKVFKKEMEHTPVAYLQEYRINKAMEMMVDQTVSIKEIAFGTGYSNQQYFSKKFKEITGMTPLEYRNSLFRKM